MQPRDFSTQHRFPGTVSSPFDGLIRLADAVERLPAPVFAALLFALALVPTRGDLPLAFGLWLFFAGDWALLAALPRAHKSFGPAKPPTLLLACLRAIPAVLPLPWSPLAQIIGTALVIYGFWIEPHRVGVTRQTLHSAKLQPTAKPLRVLHLGDLHVERITGRERQVLAHVRALAPDLILFSGYFLNLSTTNDPVAWEETRAILRELTAPFGVFAVTGSPPVDKPEVMPRLFA